MTNNGSTLGDRIVYEPPPAFAEQTNIKKFKNEYGIDSHGELIERTCSTEPAESERGVEWFWEILPDYLDIEFFTEPDSVRDNTRGPQFSQWYPGGGLNIAHNAVDRHATSGSDRRDEVAVVWEGEPGDVRKYTYADLHCESNQVANALETHGIGAGDTVGIFMPMLPETVSALYGCLKTGAIAVPIFSGFGTDAAAKRLEDAQCELLLAADGFYRRGSVVRLADIANKAIDEAGCVNKAVLLERVESGETITATECQSWTDAIGSQSDRFDTVVLDSSHPSMLLYSSGTTGKPKGIVHTHAGLQLQPTKEVYFGFDHKESDLFFWVSDLGWLMGPWTLIGNHTVGGSVFLYEGAPDYPNPDRYWEMIDRHDISTFGISPTAIRTLQKHGTDWVDDHDLSSLRLLGSTGGPWDRESWMWFYEHVGRESTPIINISGGTEIGGCFLMPMPDQPLKPCSLGGPSPGMNVDIVDDSGHSIADSKDQGYLVARDSCPGFTDSLWSGDERYLEEYWSTWDDLWDHGDWAQKDEDGFWYILGRADDALNVAGKKVGPAEIESILINHSAVNQAAVCGVPDETSGTAVIAFVVLETGRPPGESLSNQLNDLVGSEHGKPFRPREILFVDELPKTQSGKVIRRALSAVYQGDDPGDLSSIENPASLTRIENQVS